MLNGLNSEGEIIATVVMLDQSSVGAVMPTMGVFVSRKDAFQDIGRFGGLGMWGAAINNAGQVIGSGETVPRDPAAPPAEGPPSHAFLYDHNRLQDLGTLGGKSSRANAINDSGWIVGQADTANANHHAFLYRNGKMQDLGVLGGLNSEALFVNAAGQIVGIAEASVDPLGGPGSQPPRHAFIYLNGRIQDLGTFGGDNCMPGGINAAGDVVGSADVTREITGNGTFRASTRHAFLYRVGKMTDLGTLGGLNSRANAINDAGQIVGASDVGAVIHRPDSWDLPVQHAFLYTNGKMQDLGAIGGKNSVATAINSSGQIVGYLSPDFSFVNDHAFLCDHGKMQDLNVLIGEKVLAKIGIKVLVSADGINDRGQIYGRAFDVNGLKVAYVLTPAKTSFLTFH